MVDEVRQGSTYIQDGMYTCHPGKKAVALESGGYGEKEFRCEECGKTFEALPSKVM